MSGEKQRVDFKVDEFDKIVKEKGYDLLHEKSMLCSCINDDGQNAASCKYCNNSGRRYVETGKNIKAIMTGISNDKDFRESGISNTGIVTVTTHAKNRLSFLDKLTLLDGRIVYNEVISSLDLIPTLRYPLVEIECVASLHNTFVKEVDYNVINGQFTWLKEVIEPYSIRYITYPVFIVLNFPNVIRGTFHKPKTTNITYAELPVKAIAKLEFRLTDRDVS